LSRRDAILKLPFLGFEPFNLQRREANRHAVFFVHPREALEAHHERLDPPDPRITHQMVLRVDPYGNVKQSVAISYRRTSAPSFTIDDPSPTAPNSWTKTQQRTLLMLTQTSYTNAIDERDSWRTPLPAEVSTFELTDGDWSNAHWKCSTKGRNRELQNASL
jgi:hypothetical protein